MDICNLYITQAIEQAGWDLITWIRREVILIQGSIVVWGDLSPRNREKKKMSPMSSPTSWEFLFESSRPRSMIHAPLRPAQIQLARRQGHQTQTGRHHSQSIRSQVCRLKSIAMNPSRICSHPGQNRQNIWLSAVSGCPAKNGKCTSWPSIIFVTSIR